MASKDDDKFSSSKKRPKLETAESDEVPCKVDKENDGDDDDESTMLSPNNLEHLPIEILMHIFTYTDDIGLLNLAINSSRFEKIAKVVFTDRYADKYFKINSESKQQIEIYEEQFSRFGSGIRAIRAIDIHGIDANHWMAKMMHKHTGSRLQKLEFRECTFKNGCDMLYNHKSLTHLAILGGSCDDEFYIYLPDYQNLRKLELRSFKYIDASSLVWIFRLNPQLERLIIQPLYEYFTLPEIMEYVYEHMKHLKEFNVLDYDQDLDFNEHLPSADCIEKFLEVMGGLDTLGFSIEPEILDMCHRLSSICCQNVKHLELHCDNKLMFTDWKMRDAMEVAGLFQNIETLSLNINTSYNDTAPILSLIENLPNLRHLHIAEMESNLSDWVIKLLQKGKNLEKLVIPISSCSRPDSFLNSDDEPADFYQEINVDFHSRFLNTKQKSNVVIDFIKLQDNYQKIIGRVTDNEIVWRNKLMHWIGYDPIYSKSNVNLLNLGDLVDGNTNSERSSSKNEQKNPFDLILDYLDLNSLYALHECSSRSKQLVEDYVRRQSEQGGNFAISNEFYLSFRGLKQFAPYIKNLELEIVENFTTIKIKNLIEAHYKNLTKLHLRTHILTNPDEFILPNVQHYSYCYVGYYTTYSMRCKVISLAEKCAHLKTLEFRTAVYLRNKNNDPLPSFPNLQVFKFKPNDADQIKFATELFAKNGTEIIILDYCDNKNLSIKLISK